MFSNEAFKGHMGAFVEAIEAVAQHRLFSVLFPRRADPIGALALQKTYAMR